jgi:hypothetical protein
MVCDGKDVSPLGVSRLYIQSLCDLRWNIRMRSQAHEQARHAAVGIMRPSNHDEP